MAPSLSIPFEAPVVQGTFLKRYKRFLADVQIGNAKSQQVHVANPGSMKSCLFPNHSCLLTHHGGKDRKLPYSLEAIQGDDSWIGVNTHNAGRIAEVFLKQIFENVRSEVTLSAGWRTDFVVTDPATKTDIIIEVKNVSLKEGAVAAFPDAITQRGQKHLRHMLTSMKKGTACGLLLVVQRTDCVGFTPAAWIDPLFTQLFWDCLKAGLWLTIISVGIDTKGFHYHSALPLLGKFKP